jgi:hypothetical protein
MQHSSATVLKGHGLERKVHEMQASKNRKVVQKLRKTYVH